VTNNTRGVVKITTSDMARRPDPHCLLRYHLTQRTTLINYTLLLIPFLFTKSVCTYRLVCFHIQLLRKQPQLPRSFNIQIPTITGETLNAMAKVISKK
jgi:hypothetical protein